MKRKVCNEAADCSTVKKIGYAILTWNSAHVIEKCIRSIMAMDAWNASVIVVDNGSTDETRAILESMEKEYPDRLSAILLDQNQGTTVTRNMALRRLKENAVDLYCVLDSDTQINEAAMKVLIEELQAHPKYGMIGPEMHSSDGKVQMSGRNFPTASEKLYKAVPIKSIQKIGEKKEDTCHKGGGRSYPVDYLMSACWLVRPSALDAAGYLDENIFYAPEDAEYCIRIWKAGYQVAFCPAAQILHEWQRLSKKKFFSRMNWEHLKGLAYLFRKHHYLWNTDSLRKAFAANKEEK